MGRVVREFAPRASLAFTLALLVFAGSCGGGKSGLSSQPTAGGPPASQPAGPAPQLSRSMAASPAFPVVVRPQAKVQFGLKVASFATPVQLLAGLAGPQHRASAFSESDLLKDASALEATLPKHNINGPGDPLTDFDSTFNAASPNINDLAYATYKFFLQGYPGNRPQTVEFTWDSPPAANTGYYVGFSDFTNNRWDWYGGPDDTVLTVPNLTDYQDGSGNMLAIVVVTDNQTCTLRRLRVGALETRGTGLDATPDLGANTGGAPPLLGGGTLPASVDLRPGLGPIRNQGQLGSCLTFASSDGAYNFILHKLYGNAWNLNNDKFCVSPKWLYQHTGECSEVGRWTEVLDYLRDNGVATWKDAPYDGACGDTWNASESTADAAVLKITSWKEVDCKNAGGITTLKNILAFEDKPAIFGMWLDQTFMAYTGGVWNWVGPFDKSLGHAMLICGYDDAKQAFLVRNSWGPDWGENGYIWISYNTFKNPNVQMHAFTITDDVSDAVKTRFLGGGGGGGIDPPGAVSASDGTHTDFIHVTWAAVTGATSYELFRDSSSGAALATVNSGSTLQYDDHGLTAGDSNSHNYWVKALKNSSKSALSEPDSGYLGNTTNLAPQITGVFYYGNFAPGQQIQVWAEGSGADPLTFAWDFGGGAAPNKPTTSAPTVTLGAAGLYHGSLKVSNGSGNDTFNFDYTLGGGSGGPTAALTADTNSAPQGADILFDASGSTGAITDFLWEFTGDSTYDYNSGSSPYLSLNFPNPGNYTVFVTAVDANGLYDTASYGVTITAGGGNSPPVAALGADVFSGNATLQVNFDASGSTDVDGNITEYQWDFEGDGIVDQSTGASPLMTVNYPFPGVYYPTVYVIDSAGAYSYAWVTVTVF